MRHCAQHATEGEEGERQVPVGKGASPVEFLSGREGGREGGKREEVSENRANYHRVWRAHRQVQLQLARWVGREEGKGGKEEKRDRQTYLFFMTRVPMTIINAYAVQSAKGSKGHVALAKFTKGSAWKFFSKGK